MTEKRFEERYEGERIVSVKDNINDKNINIKEMVALLNELHEENQELKKRLKALDDAFMDFEQKLYLEVFDIQISKEDEKRICEMNNLILKDLFEGDIE